MQIKRTAYFRTQRVPHLLLGHLIAEAYELELQTTVGDDLLYWSAVDRPENSTQRFVPGDNAVESLLEGCTVQWAFNVQCAGYVVDGTARVKLIQKPEPFLCER